MAINKKLIHFAKKQSFIDARDSDQILPTSICFIQETREIYTHGQLYSCDPDILKQYTTNEAFDEHIESQNKINDNKANIEDLSNIIGEEVSDDVLLDQELNKPIGVVVVDSSTSTISAIDNRYYRIDGAVNDLELTLPEVEGTRLHNVVFSFTTGNAPRIFITGDASIKYFQGFEIRANTTYELNCMYNGKEWLVGYGIIE